MSLSFNHYKTAFQFFSEKTAEVKEPRSAKEFQSAKNNSLTHIAYERRVKDGIIVPQQDCSNCVCFGDEWPL